MIRLFIQMYYRFPVNYKGAITFFIKNEGILDGGVNNFKLL